jgi:environmental stress-induced protein Ves
MMRILPATDYLVMPWKNGQGATTEILRAPAGASLDAFDWRVSIATVGTDGPFSSFPEIDRTLTVLTGAGLALTLAGQPPIELTPRSAPLAFPGDVETSATLVSGPITDFNVMSRRGCWTHQVRRFDGEAAVSVTSAATVILAFCASGAVVVAGPYGSARLGPQDSLLAEPQAPASWTIAPQGPACLFWVEFRPVPSD